MQTFGLRYPHDDPTWTLTDSLTEHRRRAPSVTPINFDGVCRDCGYEDPDKIETIECPECGAIGTVGTAPDPDGKMLVFINGVCPECGHAGN